jgi:hypothetical protein
MLFRGSLIALLLIAPQEPDGRAAVAAIQKKIQGLAGDAVRREIDPAALAASLGHQADKLFLAARDLPFQPYSGALRGATGSLLAGSANDVDRCLLLQEMLRSGPGKPETRFAFGEIPEAQAVQLASRALTPSATRSRKVDAAPTRESLAAAEKAVVASAAPRVKKMAGHLGADQAGLEQALKAAGVALTGTEDDSVAARARALRSHVWLQVKIDGKWTDFDPSFPEAAPGWAPGTAARNAETLPPELDHAIGIRIVVERMAGTDLVAETAYAGRRPTRDLAGRAINISVLPAGFDVEKMTQSLDAMAPKFQKFQAVVDWGGSVENARVFDGHGKLYESKDGKFGADFGGAVGGRLEGAFGRKPQSLLVAVRLELETTSPGGGVQRASRVLLDRLKPGSKVMSDSWTDDRRFRLALLQSWTIWPAIGTVSDAFLFERVARMLTSLPTFIFDADKRPKVSEVADRLDPLPLGIVQFWQTALQLSQGAFKKGEGSCFPERPSLFVWKEAIVPAEKSGVKWRGGVDLIAAPLGCVAKAPADGARARFLYGMLLSEGESALMEKGGAAVYSASTVFRKAREAKTPIVVLKGKLEGVTLDPAAAVLVGEELKAGRAVVMPKEPVEIGGRKATAWWRVDPATGACLGIGDTGEGQAVSEGVLVLENISIPMVKRCMKFVICFNGAIVGGRSMQAAGAECMTEFMRDHLKETIEGAIDHFVVSPLKQKVTDTAEGAVKDMVDSDLASKLYDKAKEAYGETTEIIDGFAGQLVILLSFGHEIAGYAAERRR